jgi:uncharacterized protein
MISYHLTPEEARVIGCLMEKSVVTPDLYPLTLNSLTNACNQKSSRNPVMNMSQGEVQHTVRALAENNLVHIEENFKRGIEKYSHRFCNTRYSELQLNEAQFSIICLMLLRGPQTPGEIRSRSGRLHTFADNAEVVVALEGLIDYHGNELVVKLPRAAGRKDSEYMHQLSGPIDIDAYESAAIDSEASRSSQRVSVSELAQRVSELETELSELKKFLEIDKS